MIPPGQYMEVFSSVDLAMRYADQIQKHTVLEAPTLGPSELKELVESIRPEPNANGGWSVVWTHSRAPGGRAVLRGPSMTASEQVLRYALGGRSNYGRLRLVFENVCRAAEEVGLVILYENDLLGCDWLRCIDTGYALLIVSSSGYPLQSSYVLYLWSPGGNTPRDVSAWSAEQILRLGFTPVRRSLRQLALDVLEEARTPVPSTDLRTQLERRGRRTTPRELATVVAKEPFSFRKSSRDAYLAPALNEQGKPVRGWYTRSDWQMTQRIIVAGRLEEARRRAKSVFAGEQPAQWPPDVVEALKVAGQDLQSRSVQERTFGLKGTGK